MMAEHDQEKELVKKVRELVKDLNDKLTDFDILRWIQAFDFNVDETASNLRRHLRLMNSWDLKSYQRNPIVYKYWPYGLLGPTGKGDNILFIETTGLADEAMIQTVPKTEFFRTRMYDMEFVMNAIREREKATGRQWKVLLIFDFEHLEYGANLLSLATGHHKNFSSFFLSQYPEVFEKFVAVNVPNFFYYIIQAVTAVLPESITSRFVCLSSDWKKEILEYVEADALPVHWGGTMVDENNDPMCRTKVVVPPGKVPKEFYWTPEKGKFPDEELEVLEVVSGSSDYVTVRAESGQTLEWYFLTDNGWAFGIYFTEDEDETDSDEMQMVFPDFGLFTFATEIPENDKIICRKSGFYKLKFDNGHAWWATLTVKYKTILS